VTGKKPLTYTTLLLSLACLISSVVLQGFYLLIPVSVLLILSLFQKEGRQRAIFRVRTWIIILSPVVICSLLTGERDLLLLSTEGLMTGAVMACRAFCIIISISLITCRITITDILRFFERRGMKGFGLALGVAYNMLFDLSRGGRVVFETLRLRGVVRRKPFKALGLFVVSVIYNALGHADDIVNAATVRGFDTGE
jgi:energy-coupling factor transporter transmembrane protein EcfT